MPDIIHFVTVYLVAPGLSFQRVLQPLQVEFLCSLHFIQSLGKPCLISARAGQLAFFFLEALY